MNKAFIFSLFFFCFFFLTLFSSGFVDSQDGFQYLAIARRIYYDHTFELPEADYPEHNVHLSVSKTPDGKRYSPTGLGYSLALLPAVFVEDIFLRKASLEPLDAFPLESDWPVLLFASMTNAFFGALLCVIMSNYFFSFGVSAKKSVGLSLSLLISSNLFPYTKHVFAHMMFISFLMLSFFLIYKYSQLEKRIYLFLSGISFGVVLISYNPTFLFVLPSLGVYHLLLVRRPFYFSWFKELAKDVLFGLIGVLPFGVLYFWFNAVRFGGAISTGYGKGGIPLPTVPPLYVLFDGSWNLLFSAGKSIFLFSPILLLLLFFWHKIPFKKLKPELIAFGLMFAVYFYFTATLLGGVDYLLWHGDSSWGPRYLLPVLPGLLLIVGLTILQLSKKQKILIVLPLLVIGFWIQLCGMLLPYQIRFAGLQTDAQFNGRNFNVYEYGNIIPRYSPVFTMSKTLAKRIIQSNRLFDRGRYNLHLKDGFDRPFRPTLDSVWREIHSPAILTWKSPTNSLTEFSIQLRNHSIVPTSTYSAQVKVFYNLTQIAQASVSANQEQQLAFVIDQPNSGPLSELVFEPSFVGTTSASLPKQQVIFLQSLTINNQPQNLNLIDYPYISPISHALFNAEYQYYGNIQQDPWVIWHMHSGVYEETFDLWWLRPFHYWDFPKYLFASLFVLNILGVGITAVLLVRFSHHKLY